MCVDFAIHNKHDGNPHAHIMLTMRSLDENGKWLPKSRKEYILDENGERIREPSGYWKSRKVYTNDWNNKANCEIWRHGWETIQNEYLERNGRPERVSLKSFERQGIDKVPTVHMGPAVAHMEEKGIELTPQMIDDYVMRGGTPHLDGQYTVFGEVIEGMEVVKKIQQTETDKNDRPLTDVVIRRMIVEQ